MSSLLPLDCLLAPCRAWAKSHNSSLVLLFFSGFGLRFSSVLQIYLFIFVFALRLLRFFSTFFDALKIYANTLGESIKFAYLSICFACFLPARLLFAALCLLLPAYFNYFEPSRVCPKLFKLDLHSSSRRPETRNQNQKLS